MSARSLSQCIMQHTRKPSNTLIPAKSKGTAVRRLKLRAAAPQYMIKCKIHIAIVASEAENPIIFLTKYEPFY